MTPATTDVRAAVFAVRAVDGTDEVTPLAWFGRREPPRTFSASTVEGDEVFAYLTSATPRAELHRDVTADAPANYNGDMDRYRTFIRVPVFANNVVFGMLTVDAPKPGTLSDGDVKLAELVAAQMAVAFAIAADG